MALAPVLKHTTRTPRQQPSLLYPPHSDDTHHQNTYIHPGAKLIPEAVSRTFESTYINPPPFPPIFFSPQLPFALGN